MQEFIEIWDCIVLSEYIVPQKILMQSMHLKLHQIQYLHECSAEVYDPRDPLTGKPFVYPDTADLEKLYWESIKGIKVARAATTRTILEQQHGADHLGMCVCMQESMKLAQQKHRALKTELFKTGQNDAALCLPFPSAPGDAPPTRFFLRTPRMVRSPHTVSNAAALRSVAGRLPDRDDAESEAYLAHHTELSELNSDLLLLEEELITETTTASKVAVDETAIPLTAPLPLAGVSTRGGRGAVSRMTELSPAAARRPRCSSSP